MNAKTHKMIRKYARLRGKGEKAINPDLLTKIYYKSDDKKRELFKKEMIDYFNAIDAGLIQQGQSLLHVIVNSEEVSNDSFQAHDNSTETNP